MAQEPPFPLRADCELIELHGREQTQIRIHVGPQVLHLKCFPDPLCCLQEDTSRSAIPPRTHLDAGVRTGQLGELDAPAIVHIPQAHLPETQENYMENRPGFQALTRPLHWEELHLNHLLGIISIVSGET